MPWHVVLRPQDPAFWGASTAQPRHRLTPHTGHITISVKFSIRPHRQLT
jgi:hypothetical protein